MNAIKLLVIGALALLSCATVSAEKFAWRDGWREAEVVDVLLGSEMARPHFFKCSRPATAEQLATTRYAIVKYRSMSRVRKRAVPLEPSATFARGDALYVNVTDCSTVPVRRATRAGRG